MSSKAGSLLQVLSRGSSRPFPLQRALGGNRSAFRQGSFLIPVTSFRFRRHLQSDAKQEKPFQSPPLIRDILQSKQIGSPVVARGWVRWAKVQKEIAFIHLEDGSSSLPLQVVCTNQPKELKSLSSGTSIEVQGTLVQSSGHGQSVEVQLSSYKVLGPVEPLQYPLQPKTHSAEFLREIAHFRPRTKQFGAVLRIRNAATMALHKFFQDHKFVQVHTPILTTNDCEGGGNVFRINSFPPEINKYSKKENNEPEEFFRKPTFLTVSGQLHAEMMACALTRVYSFGPTFRAEPGVTSKHLAEFWMLEPEIAFCDLETCMDYQEEMVKRVTLQLLQQCEGDFQLVHQQNNPKLREELEKMLITKFPRISFSDAISILKQAASSGNFKFPVSENNDLQTEHEKYLSEVHFKGPVFVRDWPKHLKPFYMRLNDDNQTLAAVDLLVPGIGELIGGSAREERFDYLQAALEKTNLNAEGQLNWYLDLRKFGTVPHAGFGLGFERYIQFITGINNIRDVTPLPRYSRHCNY